MSTNQVKADPIESQLKRGGRGSGGAVYRATTQASAKGGGTGGLGPSAAAPPQSNQHPVHSGQHPIRPAHGNVGGRRKTNGGHAWQHYPSASTNGEPLLQPVHRQQPQQQQQQQQHQQHQHQHQQQHPANLSGPAPRRPAQNNGTVVKQPVPPSTTPEKSQPVFQFGSVSPGFGHGHNVGMQIPARTTSAPPNLDEQKREQAQFEAAMAAKHMPVLPHGPVLDHPSGQHHLAPVVRQVHMPVPVQVVASQPQGQGSIQQPLQSVLPGMVQPNYTPAGKFQQQQPPAVIASQVATPIVGQQPIIGHQIPQVAYPYHFQPRPNRAIKIVDPKTQEEVRLDMKMADNRPPLSGVVQQPRPVRGNHYPSQGSSFSTSGTPYYPESPRYVYNSPSLPYRGTQAPSSVLPSGTATESSLSSVSTPEVPPEVSIASEVDLKVEGHRAEEPAQSTTDTGSADEEKIVENDQQIVQEDAVEPAVISDQPVESAAPVTNDPGLTKEDLLHEESSQENSQVTDSDPKSSSSPLKENVESEVEVKLAESNAEQVAPDVADQNDQQHSQPSEVVVEVKHVKKKKNRKQLLAKADAAGSTADLYNAYKAPDEKQQDAAKMEVAEQQEVEIKPDATHSLEEEEPSGKELEDWEDAADLPTPSTFNQNVEATKRYTRDFLLTCRGLHLSLPADFEARPDIDSILIPQSDAGVRGPPRRPEEERWLKAAAVTPSGRPQDIRVDGGFRPGGMSPGMRFPSPMLGNIPPHMVPGRGVDGLSWIHQRGLIPSPHTPLPAMHKAEKRYEIGKISDEEEAKQRQVKGILNKLTPQNFEKLFDQVQDLGIETAATLTGVISQIFDKAVMEPTFCETYARFCVQLSVALPEFTEEGEKVTFKRVLLNKCQEEFERGKREEEEAGKIEEDGVSFSPEEREIKRVKARRRMLGNIRFIGELYKNSMLTERIMHQCIKTLLGEYQNPDEEDVEALCKLMTTIGQLIDHNKAKAHMDAYFDRILDLSNNQKLPSRLRFGLKDVIDLRRNDWQQRRKVEGPKKIEEVHRDAQQEQQQQQRMANQGSRFSRGTMSRRMPPPSPGAMSPMGRGGMPRFVQDARKEEPYVPMQMPPQRTEDFAFVPQGGLGRMRPPPKLQVETQRRPGTAPSDRGPPYTSRDDFSARGFGAAERPLLDRPMTAGPGMKEYRGLERSSSDRLAGYASSSSSAVERPSTPPTPVAQPPALTEEQLKKKGNLAIEEYYSARDVKEVGQCVEELGRSDFHATMVSDWILDSFERKDVERDLLAKLIKHLHSTDPPLLTNEQMENGFAAVLSVFEDMLVDVPRAADYLGNLMGKLAAFNVLPLPQSSRLVREGGSEKDSLLLSNDALNIFGSVLETIRKETSEEEMLEMYRASGVSIHDFVLTPSAGEVEKLLRKRKLLCLDPLLPVEDYLTDALDKNVPAPEILKWLQTNAASLFTNSGFLRMLMTEVLRHTVLPLPATDFETALKGKTKKFSELLRKITAGNSKTAAASQRQYIEAVQQFAHAQRHPAGLMTALFKNFYDEEVILEKAFVDWQDDVNDTAPGREQAIREVGMWLRWLAEAPEEDAGDD